MKPIADYELTVQFQLRGRLGLLRQLLRKTGRLHIAESEEPERARWDCAHNRVVFYWPGVTYSYSLEHDTAAELREDWMIEYRPDGSVDWIRDARAVGPTPWALLLGVEGGRSGEAGQN